jgi:transmembrane sensor
MTPALHHPDDEEAALWVARHMGGPVDATAFNQWLAGAPGRREMFDALWATCFDDAVTEELRRQDRVEQDNEPAPMLAPDVAPRRTGRWLALGAGGVAALLAIGVLALPAARFAMLPAQSFQSATGQVRSVTLADGSTVVLNGASRISARIGAGRREVALEAGEALFDVKHDPARPFTVTAGAGRVTVLGTRFDLALNRRNVDLEVERGLVRFEGNGDGAPVLVAAAQRSTLADGRVAAPTALAGTTEAWRTGWLRVTAMPLDQIIPRLERWTDKTIVVKNPALLHKQIAGRFRLSDPKVVLENLGALYGFRVEDRGQTYVLDAQ